MIVVSLVAVISMIAFLVSRQTEQRGAVEFFASADESSSLHAAASTELESALASIGVAERQDLTLRLQNVSDKAAAADALLDPDIPSGIGIHTSLRSISYNGAEALSSARDIAVKTVTKTSAAIAQ